MARIRTIKPEFFTSEDIVGMTPLARLFYVSLWCESDREGRLEWKPGTFKMRYLPGDDCSIDDLAGELVDKGLIILYSIDGKEYAQIPTFVEHQVINNREHPSKIPEFSEHATLTRESRVEAEGRKGRKGKEGREGNSSAENADDGQVLVPVPDASAEKAERREKRRCTPEDELLARKCYGRILANNASATAPNFASWAEDIRLMRERDHHTLDEIFTVFDWAQSDHFWQSNILSMGKLREKWNQLTSRMASIKRPPASLPNSKFNFDQVDRSGDRAAQAATVARHNIVVPDGEVEL